MKKSLVPLICTLGTVGFVLGACGSDSGDTSSGKATATFSPSAGNGADDSTSADDPSFKDGVLTTPDLKVEITRYKIIKAGQKGNDHGKKPVIAFWYKTTNLSGAKVDPMVAFIVGFNLDPPFDGGWRCRVV
jgi:hypothetical protein